MKRKPPKPTPARTTATAPKKSLAEKLENWLEKNSGQVLLVILFISLIFSFLLFDIKMSEGNDDSEYIEGAYKFSKDITSFFSSKAPLYPILLSLPVAVFGINIILLKSFSLLFHLFQIYFLYKAFQKIIPFTCLFSILFFLAVNDYFQYFASQTYSESFFLFLQSLFLYSFRKLYDNHFGTENTHLKLWLQAGFVLFLLTITRNISIAVLPAVLLFFTIRKKFIASGYLLISFVVFRGIFEVVKSQLWPGHNQFKSQLEILRRKDPYDASKGLEDISGFFERFLANTDIYLSKRFFQILGFINESSTETKTALTFFIIILFSAGLYMAFRKRNDPVIFSSLYLIFLCGLTFLVLQTRWDQPRFVMVGSHLILLTIFSGIYSIVHQKLIAQSFLYFLPLSIILLSSLISSTTKAINNIDILKHNLKGDIYYGYTPDWQHFLKMSKYCVDSLPPDSYVASRKAPMSFIYSKGKYFYPVYSVFSTDADSILETFRKEKVTHVLVASLRRNPARQDGYVINTMHRLLQPVVEKYPHKIKLVKQIGESEPAFLYEIKYE